MPVATTATSPAAAVTVAPARPIPVVTARRAAPAFERRRISSRRTATRSSRPKATSSRAARIVSMTESASSVRAAASRGPGPAGPGEGEGDDDHGDRPGAERPPDARVDDGRDGGPEDDARRDVDRGGDPPGVGRRHDLGVGNEAAQHGAGAAPPEPPGDERLERVVEAEPESAEDVEGDVVDPEPFEVAGEAPPQGERLNEPDRDAEDEHGGPPGGPRDEPSRGRQEADAAGGTGRAGHDRPGEAAWSEAQLPGRARPRARGRGPVGPALVPVVMASPTSPPGPPPAAGCLSRAGSAAGVRPGRTGPLATSRPGRRGPPPPAGA